MPYARRHGIEHKMFQMKIIDFIPGKNQAQDRWQVLLPNGSAPEQEKDEIYPMNRTAIRTYLLPETANPQYNDSLTSQ
jgi:hypothetical protein